MCINNSTEWMNSLFCVSHGNLLTVGRGSDGSDHRCPHHNGAILIFFTRFLQDLSDVSTLKR